MRTKIEKTNLHELKRNKNAYNSKIKKNINLLK